jgi:hypothetical protein
MMAKNLCLFFPDSKTADIHVCDLAAGLVEGTMDNGDTSFSFKANKTQILALLDMAEAMKIVTPEDKKANPTLYEDPLPPVEEKDESAKPSGPAPIKFKIGSPSTTPPAHRPPPPPGFSPPTMPLATDRQRLTKPGEQGLMDDFEKSWPNKFAGRKKLDLKEAIEKDTRDKAISIARSYILAGDRTTVKTWVEYNKATR